MEISVDTGNKQMKTLNETFTSGVYQSDVPPSTGKNADFMRFNGKYYILTEELYQIYHAMIRGENYKAETLEVLMEEGQPVIKIAGNEIRAAFEQLNDFVQKLILLTERTLPLGSVVEIDVRKLEMETEKPVSSIKAVIVDRFMKKETEKQYVPYCGIIYPFGDSKKQLFFTEQAIHTVIHYGYTDRQEDAYVALIKREIIKKGYSSYSFAEAEDDKIRMLQSDINL